MTFRVAHSDMLDDSLAFQYAKGKICAYRDGIYDES